jgi:hypothetical protein
VETLGKQVENEGGRGEPEGEAPFGVKATFPLETQEPLYLGMLRKASLMSLLKITQ